MEELIKAAAAQALTEEDKAWIGGVWTKVAERRAEEFIEILNILKEQGYELTKTEWKPDIEKAANIAQWVIDNRYPKSEFDKVSDLEMFNSVKDSILYETRYTEIIKPRI